MPLVSFDTPWKCFQGVLKETSGMSQSILMEKTIPKQYNRKINNSNNKKMSKESKSRFDFFWTDDEIQSSFICCLIQIFVVIVLGQHYQYHVHLKSIQCMKRLNEFIKIITWFSSSLPPFFLSYQKTYFWLIRDCVHIRSIVQKITWLQISFGLVPLSVTLNVNFQLGLKLVKALFEVTCWN